MLFFSLLAQNHTGNQGKRPNTKQQTEFLSSWYATCIPAAVLVLALALHPAAVSPGRFLLDGRTACRKTESLILSRWDMQSRCPERAEVWRGTNKRDAALTAHAYWPCWQRHTHKATWGLFPRAVCKAVHPHCRQREGGAEEQRKKERNYLASQQDRSNSQQR